MFELCRMKTYTKKTRRWMSLFYRRKATCNCKKFQGFFLWSCNPNLLLNFIDLFVRKRIIKRWPSRCFFVILWWKCIKFSHTVSFFESLALHFQLQNANLPFRKPIYASDWLALLSDTKKGATEVSARCLLIVYFVALKLCLELKICLS